MFSRSSHIGVLEGNLAFFSAPMMWRQAGVAVATRGVFAIGREGDQAIANALGVGVRKITIRKRDAGGRTPQQFDRLEICGESLTVDVVLPITFQGELYAWKCLCAGHEVQP